MVDDDYDEDVPPEIMAERMDNLVICCFGLTAAAGIIVLILGLILAK